METAVWCSVIIGGYLVGAIPFGWLLAKALKSVDIRTTGSENIGATNAARVLGKKWFFIVLFLDAAKGAGPVLISRFLLEPFSLHLGIAAGVSALLGHMFPVYLKFKGGKGVATGLGVMLSLAPLATCAALASFLVVLALFRHVSLGSIVAAIVIAPAHTLIFFDEAFNQGLPLTLFICLIPVVVVIRHIENIKRLLAGTEPKIGGGKTFGGDKKPDSTQQAKPAVETAAADMES